MVTPFKKQKLKTVVEYNTLFFKPLQETEEATEKSVAVLVDSLLNLKRKVALNGCKESVFVEHLQNDPSGLDHLLAITVFFCRKSQKTFDFCESSE